MSAIVGASEVLARGVRSEFADTYRRHYTGAEARLNRYMEMAIPSTREVEAFAYFLSAPHAKLWQKGRAISEAAMISRSFNVVNRDWGIRVPWFENDERYDQTRSLVNSVRDAGKSMAILAERVAIQMIRGATDNDLLPAVPNAADGVGLFSSTDGTGAARYGVTGGNVFTGTGVASATAILNDLYGAISQALRWQDTEGQPLFNRDQLEGAPVMILYNAANEYVFQQAFSQKFIQGTSAAVSNIVLDSSFKYELWGTQRITDNKWYIVFQGVPKKSLVQTVVAGIRDNLADMTNSDTARTYKTKYIQWDMSAGYGIPEAFGLMQVFN